MSVRRLSLERFDGRAAAPGTVAREQPAPAGGDRPAEAPPGGPAATGPEPRHDPPDARPDPHPATVRLAAVAESLERLAAEMPRLRDAVLHDAARRFGRAAEAAVPRLAAMGFAAEVAAASLAIVRAGAPPGVVLRAAPEEADEISARLAAASPSGRSGALRVEADASLPPGAARLDWSDGGAEFDADRIAAAALACLHREIAIPAEEDRER